MAEVVEKATTKPNRKGVFIGAYIPADMKEQLQKEASRNHRTLSQELHKMIAEHLENLKK